MNHLVRDEGVAGSNPATPTKYPLATLNFHPYVRRLVCCGSLGAMTAPTTMYVSDPVSGDANRRERVRVYLPAATSCASFLRA